ncbi:MAG: zinc carboxypeptidase [Sphingobacteriales bacterium]|nr:MAG: zinc carboxypeptidase [Sphingobacteriales bacterium]
MKHKLFISLLICICSLNSIAQLKSPDQFLGYKLGERFTPHYKIVQYFEHAAAAAPQLMKLEKYGETNEGRPLMLASISSPENMGRLEEIRTNNLKLTGLQAGTGNTSSPAIVWLSYNVHGNEASSSEVSMKTLYELLSGSNAQARQWLKNLVVLIDPCLNPDGRDRYVNWYNQVVGKHFNASVIAREHSEPWPGGRTNHYNFDLNRDWAWQTQVESKHRLVKYQQWMPQVHVDFHEQGYQSPYYFAPAAEPLHEVITPWQRDFQTTIGKNHARYFDENGWLYFTKEYFDLFYPSYGDSYPIYNGSIGMTYEQAGHGMAGLAIVAGEEDTLKLTDRIAHHFTTSISTLEVAAKNADGLMKEFKKYFDDNNNGLIGEYKTYIVSGAEQGKLDGLKKLFDNNKIVYSYASRAAPVKTYNYLTGKEETYTIKENDLLISSYQPKASLVKVLFEPVSKLFDSATYDITAWALPYVYGVQAYASKERINGKSTAPAFNSITLPTNGYGYLVNYNAFNDGQLLAALLKHNIKVRFAEKDFSYNGAKYNRGSLVVLKKGNEDKIQQFLELAAKLNSKVNMVASGFMESGFDFGSDKLRLISKPNVAMLTGEEADGNAAGEVWHLFEEQLNFPITLINSTDLRTTSLKNIDVLILPNGYYKMLSDKDQAAELKAWIRQGGRLIALDNVTTALGEIDASMKLKKAEDKPEDSKADPYADLKKYGNRERDWLVNNVPGAIYKVELDNTHPLAFGYGTSYYSLKLSSTIFEFGKDSWNVGVVKKDKQTAGFVGSKLREKIVDGTVIGVTTMGRGQVIYFADDPIFRSFWENGKLMFTNAVFLVGQ